MSSTPLAVHPAPTHRTAPHARVRTAGRHPVEHLLMLASLVLSLLVLAPMFVGAATGTTAAVVRTGSMVPVLHPGDVVLARPVTDPQVGDILQYPAPARVRAKHLDTTTVTHRLVGIADDGRLVTRGDANPVVDPETLDPAAPIEKVHHVVPFLGLVALHLHGAVPVLAGLALLATALGTRRPR